MDEHPFYFANALTVTFNAEKGHLFGLYPIAKSAMHDLVVQIVREMMAAITGLVNMGSEAVGWHQVDLTNVLTSIWGRMKIEKCLTFNDQCDRVAMAH